MIISMACERLLLEPKEVVRIQLLRHGCYWSTEYCRKERMNVCTRICSIEAIEIFKVCAAAAAAAAAWKACGGWFGGFDFH